MQATPTATPLTQAISTGIPPGLRDAWDQFVQSLPHGWGAETWVVLSLIGGCIAAYMIAPDVAKSLSEANKALRALVLLLRHADIEAQERGSWIPLRQVANLVDVDVFRVRTFHLLERDQQEAFALWRSESRVGNVYRIFGSHTCFVVIALIDALFFICVASGAWPKPQAGWITLSAALLPWLPCVLLIWCKRQSAQLQWNAQVSPLNSP